MKGLFKMGGRYFQMGGEAAGMEQDPSMEMGNAIVEETPALSEQQAPAGQFSPEIQQMFDSLTPEQQQQVMAIQDPAQQEQMIIQLAQGNVPTEDPMAGGATDPMAAMAGAGAAPGADPMAAMGGDPMAAMRYGGNFRR